MKTALYSALLLVTLTVTGAVLVVTYDLHRDLAAAHLLFGQVSASENKLDPILEQANGSVRSLNTTLAKVDTVVATLNEAATEERESWKKTSTETADTAREVRKLVDEVEKSAIHVRLTTLPSIDAQITSNGDQLKATIGKLGETSDELTITFASLDRRLSDPRIDALELHLENISVNLDKTTASGAHVAKFYEDKLTKAKGIAQTIGGGAWELFKAVVTGRYF